MSNPQPVKPKLAGNGTLQKIRLLFSVLLSGFIYYLMIASFAAIIFFELRLIWRGGEQAVSAFRFNLATIVTLSLETLLLWHIGNKLFWKPFSRKCLPFEARGINTILSLEFICLFLFAQYHPWIAAQILFICVAGVPIYELINRRRLQHIELPAELVYALSPGGDTDGSVRFKLARLLGFDSEAMDMRLMSVSDDLIDVWFSLCEFKRRMYIMLYVFVVLLVCPFGLELQHCISSRLPVTISSADNIEGVLSSLSQSAQEHLNVSATWGELDLNDRLVCMQTVCDAQCELWNLRPIPVNNKELDISVLGEYDADNRVISLDTYHLCTLNLDEALELILHEMRHVYQHDLVDNIDPDAIRNTALYTELLEWGGEFSNYKDGLGDTYDDYEHQEVEIDADAYAQAHVKLYLEYIKKLGEHKNPFDHPYAPIS